MASYYKCPVDPNFLQRSPSANSIRDWQQQNKAISCPNLSNFPEENSDEESHTEHKTSNDDVPACIECIKAVPVLSANQLSPGDHIVFPRAKYDHHAIVVNVLSTDGDFVCLEIAHATNTLSRAAMSSLLSIGKAKLTKEKKSQNLKIDNVMVFIYQMQHYSPSKIVKRATENIDKFYQSQGKCSFKYDMFDNNCEHFATWCVTGRKISLQVRKVRMVFRMFLKNGFRGMSDEIQRNEKEYEYKMLCEACYKRNNALLGVKQNAVCKEDDVQIGDIIKFRYYFLWHLAVVLTKTENSTKELICTIAHYHFGGLKANTIREEQKIIPFDGSVFVFDYSAYDVYSPEEVVERARSRLGEQRFAYFSNDSSHFSRWCKLKLYSNKK